MSRSTFSAYPGTWHVQFSSRRLWHGKRNVQAIFTASNSLDYTYQDHEELEIKTHREVNWEVTAYGKDGKLESWMTETDAGIVDNSGIYFYSIDAGQDIPGTRHLRRFIFISELTDANLAVISR
jgi:hypothetical protein